jgi:hypothetical protein
MTIGKLLKTDHHDPLAHWYVPCFGVWEIGLRIESSITLVMGIFFGTKLKQSRKNWFNNLIKFIFNCSKI